MKPQTEVMITLDLSQFKGASPRGAMMIMVDDDYVEEFSNQIRTENLRGLVVSTQKTTMYRK